MAVVDAAQLRALVADTWRSEDRRRVFAVHSDPVWSGPTSMEGPYGLIHVVACVSPLAVREALLHHSDDAGVLVVLTPCPDAELGPDVLARLVRRRVLRADPFGALRALFRAKELDPALAAEPSLIEDLIALAPSGGWPGRTPLNGVLDLDLAWQTWQEIRLRIDHPPASLTEVLLAGGSADLGTEVAALPSERRAGLARWWGQGTAEPTGVIVALIAAGRGRELAALGLVAGLLWAAAPDPQTAATQAVVRARLEDLFGRDRLDPASAHAWETASVEALAHMASPSTVLDGAQALLEREGAAGLLVLSDRMAGGFEARMNAVGLALAQRDALGAGSALAAVRQHRLAEARSERLATAEAGVRLLRRSLAPADPPATTFAQAAARYAAEESWLDEALRAIAEGDEAPELAHALDGLISHAADRAQRIRNDFGVLLAGWSRSEPLPDPRLVPVERILEDVVASVAAHAPVLVLVCDGMPLAVSHGLLRALLAEGWAPTGPMGHAGWPVGVGVLPTVTEVCRTSLLAGQRQQGGQAEERAGFASNRALRAVSSPSKPPALFHKASLVAAGGTALPVEVHQALADTGRRVVGVVVNSVDDHLTRGDQVRVRWDVATMKPLRWVLDAAEEAGRLVVLTADHGHVLREPGAQRRMGSNPGGERWRTAPPGPAQGEIAISGPRVLLGGGSVILPVDDRISYGVPKAGYHGGATPAEVLVPVEVLARRPPELWVHRPLPAPAWWDGATAAVAVPGAPMAGRGRRRPAPEQDPLFQPTLDARAPQTAPSPPPVAWIERLLTSPAFAAQRTHARLPRPMADDRLRTYLGVLDANGGAIPLASLSLRTGEPADALRMALALVQRLLNLDGSAVLSVGPDATVHLDRSLLGQQFEIAVP